MTPFAVHGRIAELTAAGRSLMTCCAFQIGMNAHKRKIGFIMHIQHIHTIFPADRGMTVFALSAQLILMHIGMTVHAGDADLFKDRTLMTGSAGHFTVLAE